MSSSTAPLQMRRCAPRARAILAAMRLNSPTACPFDPDLAAILGSENDGKAPAREIEGNFIDASIMIVQIWRLVRFDMPHDGFVEQALQAGLMPTVEIGIFQGLFTPPAADIEMQAERDLVLRQRSGLVGAQHVHGAKILNGVEPFYDHALLQHGDRALGEVHRDDHREQFRRQADRDGEPEQQRLPPIALRQPIDQESRGARNSMKRIISPMKRLMPLSKSVSRRLPASSSASWPK